MAEDRPTALLDRPQAAPATVPADEAPSEPVRHGPRRWSDPDEKLALQFVGGFLLLGLYAAVFVVIGMWLTP